MRWAVGRRSTKTGAIYFAQNSVRRPARKEMGQKPAKENRQCSSVTIRRELSHIKEPKRMLRQRRDVIGPFFENKGVVDVSLRSSLLLLYLFQSH